MNEACSVIRAVAYNPIPHWGRVITNVCPGQEGIEGGCGLAHHMLRVCRRYHTVNSAKSTGPGF